MKQSKQRIKTYISEANQNRISETLSVENKNEPSLQAQVSMEPEENLYQLQDIMPEIPEIYEEPEALSAPLTPLPPTTAAYDAEAVAGFTIGETYGDQGGYVDNLHHKQESSTTE